MNRAQRSGVTNLVEVKEVLDANDIRFWLDWGTLLGTVRKGDLIAWDHDIDLGLIEENPQKMNKVFCELEKRGFKVMSVKLPYYERIEFEKSFGQRICLAPYRVKGQFAVSDIQVDLHSFLTKWLYSFYYILLYPQKYFVVSQFEFIFHTIKKFFVKLPFSFRKPVASILWFFIIRTNKGYNQVVIPFSFFQKLDTISLHGVLFKIPSNVEEYLKYHYGENWRIPDKNWIYEMDGAVRRL